MTSLRLTVDDLDFLERSEGHRPMMAALIREVRLLRAAIDEVGTECRIYAEEDRCSKQFPGRSDPPWPEVWCGGCILAEARDA